MADGNVKNFLEKELEKLEFDFKKRIINQLDGLTQIEAIKFLKELDFYRELQTAGLFDLIDTLEDEYADIIAEIIDKADDKGIGISSLKIEELSTIIELDAESILRRAEGYASEFKSSLFKGFLIGQSTQEILEGLGDIGLRTNWTIAAINTARDQFNAVTVVKLFEDNPEMKFKLSGPLDIKTRCECRAVLTKQPKEGLEREKVEQGAWHKLALSNCAEYAKRINEGKQGKYNLINRGGYNCRHFIEIVER